MIVEVYADGGVVTENPSPIGGTWAWCHVDEQGERVASGSGGAGPEFFGLHAGECVSNNVTEFYALLKAIEPLPEGWSGRILSDSGVTLTRFKRPEGARMKGLPPSLVGFMRVAVARLGEVEWVLLGGHPNRKQLAEGVRKDGKPVSQHNVWCDKKCNEHAALLKHLVPQ